MKNKLANLGFWALIGVFVFGVWALCFTEPPLQVLGVVIFLAGLLHPVIEVLAVKTIQGYQALKNRPPSARARPLAVTTATLKLQDVVPPYMPGPESEKTAFGQWLNGEKLRQALEKGSEGAPLASESLPGLFAELLRIGKEGRGALPLRVELNVREREEKMTMQLGGSRIESESLYQERRVTVL
jgi:hypothetical protein